jgi:hypothetical protein
MNAIEEAQCRVARAQEERDKLHEEIMQKHGALRDLDTACKAEKAKDSCAMYNGKAHRLRQNYQKSVAELRLAKSALERERNEAKQAEGRPSPVMDERTPMQRAVAMAEPIVLDDARVEDGALVATAPPELQDLKGGTGTVVGVLPNGDAVVELELGPEGPAEDAEGATAYDGLLQRYKAVCDRIEAFPPTYGNPTKEEKILKKERLQLRKDLKAMAPLKTCWFCCSFSINNYDNPCRSGKLDAGAVPTDACHIWELAGGSGYLDESCTVAMSEFQAEQAAKIEQEDAPAEVVKIDDCVGCVRHGHLDPEECRTCEPGGDEAGNPTHYEPAPGKQPYWEGGPLDTVNGMPWHVAVAKCPVGYVVILKPGDYKFGTPEAGPHRMVLSAPYQVYGPLAPHEVLIQVREQLGPMPEPVRAEEKDVKVEKEDLKRFLTRRIAEEEAASAARRQVQLDLELQPVKLPEGVVEDIKVSRKRVYREDFYTLSISKGDLANFSGLSFDAKRQTVATKLRIKPDEDDDFDPDDVPDQIRHFVRILDLAALRLKGERAAMEAKEALQALRGEA